MASLNKVFLIGRLTKDPDLKYLPNGTPKAELRLATSRQYVSNGEKREDTCYVDVVAWSRQAETCNQYLRKGSQICVEGRLDYQEWEAQDGTKRSKHQVVADRVQFLDTRGGSQELDGANGEMASASQGQGGFQGRGGYGGGRGGYNRGDQGAPRTAPAPVAAAAGQDSADAGNAQAPRGSGPGGVGEAMGIADDDIPF
jgi:single-strand DNA-binding protein